MAPPTERAATPLPTARHRSAFGSNPQSAPARAVYLPSPSLCVPMALANYPALADLSEEQRLVCMRYGQPKGHTRAGATVRS